MKRVLDVDLSKLANGFNVLNLTSPRLEQSTGAIVDLEIVSVNVHLEQTLDIAVSVLAERSGGGSASTRVAFDGRYG